MKELYRCTVTEYDCYLLLLLFHCIDKPSYGLLHPLSGVLAGINELGFWGTCFRNVIVFPSSRFR